MDLNPQIASASRLSILRLFNKPNHFTCSFVAIVVSPLSYSPPSGIFAPTFSICQNLAKFYQPSFNFLRIILFHLPAPSSCLQFANNCIQVSYLQPFLLLHLYSNTSIIPRFCYLRIPILIPPFHLHSSLQPSFFIPTIRKLLIIITIIIPLINTDQLPFTTPTLTLPFSLIVSRNNSP